MIVAENLLSAKILIVDDEPAIVRLLATILSSRGFSSIKSVSDSREVIQLYQEFKPDLIILDLQMPYLNGFQIMEQLKQLNPDCFLPILVLSGQSERSTRLRALESGARDFLGKPVDQAEVMCRICNMLEMWLLHKDLHEQKKLLEEKVRERTKELRDSQLEIIHRLGRAAEYRDDDTGQHIVRMSRICERIAREAGMSEEECEIILNASPMHDIGKIGISDRILLKPGKLTDAEWEIIKTHTTIGAELLSGGRSEMIRIACKIALTHHEKWDGSGYPFGLKGEDIPLAGRICAIADVFDALISPRPYKKAWPIDEALQKIKEESGKHFDPQLVPIFLRIINEVLTDNKTDNKSNKTSRWNPASISLQEASLLLHQIA
jgi:putative two-component system response regulator